MIAKRLFKTILAAFALVALASCEIETSDNGDFDGFWHLERVDTLATGGTTDLSKKRVFWGVQYKLISVRDVDVDKQHGYYLRFTQTSDKIVTHTPYTGTRTRATTAATTPSTTRRYWLRTA